MQGVMNILMFLMTVATACLLAVGIINFFFIPALFFGLRRIPRGRHAGNIAFLWFLTLIGVVTISLYLLSQGVSLIL
ncbi:hypothetical protein A2368_00715 [Candidatus Collierbacteria bacterium RIFOXYB1_FULL_49_13]|uniref:Uncharacterized protein n=1 Tax=Candidatus Collierbacteria bacterium RIFOXYB1_FULL_49_13 TaxID=1817728 RepID=A0A1F5FHI5_9BACT|nr:MAG: hypothetical protein A2368_00715 [Candidatus Collierbacteria bacterium RIFOXYB1_FULL_49_13]